MSQNYAKEEVLIDEIIYLKKKLDERSQELVKLITCIELFCDGVVPILQRVEKEVMDKYRPS